MDLLLIFITFMLTDFTTTTALRVIPERCYVTHSNPKYVENVKVTITRYNRKNNIYYENIEATLKQAWTNNVTVEIKFYEYLHNEYKPTFVEMKHKFCDMIKSDPFIGKALVNAGVTCPALPGTYKLMNMTVPNVENFPYKWPFEKGKVEIFIRTNPGMERIVEGYGIVTFDQSDQYKKSKGKIH